MSGRVLSTAIRALERADIPCALIGAMALASHGIPRTTRDADLLVADPRALDAETWSAAATRVHVEVRRGDRSDPLLGVVRLGTARARMPVDIVLPRGTWLADVVDRAHRSGVLATVDGTALPLVTLPDLVLLKADAAGTIDRLDIELILEAWPERAAELMAYVNDRLPLLDDYSRERWLRWLAQRD